MPTRRERRATGPVLTDSGSGALPPDLETTLIEISDAVDALRVWLADWHRQVVCHRPPDAHALVEDGRLRCEYGHWLADRLARPASADRQTVEQLNELHTRMHAQADRILAAVIAGQPVETSEYDAFASLVRGLDELTLDLEREWRERLVEIDPLTGLRNRRGMLQDLQVERERSVRTGAAVSVAVIDIDRFKGINDRFGHLTGDAVLRTLTRHVLRTLRPYDRAYRLGGDEFIICFPTSKVETAAAILDRVRTTLPSLSRRGRAVCFTVSAGVADLSLADHPRSALDRADEALYAAKRGGRDRVTVWSAYSADERRKEQG